MFRKRSIVVDEKLNVGEPYFSSHSLPLAPEEEKARNRDRLADYQQQVLEWLSRASFPRTELSVIHWNPNPPAAQILLLTEDEFFGRLLNAVCYAEIHEAHEWFWVDGKCWRNPHKGSGG